MGISAEQRETLPRVVLPAQDPKQTDVFEYNEDCNKLIKETLRALGEGALLRTHYPEDTDTSEDVVSLDETGEIFVVDVGDA